MTEHEQYMDRAMALAAESLTDGNRPAGAVIVRDGKVIGEGRNLVYSEVDPTAHGEIVAIRRAALNLRSVDLSGATLYTSMEPCPMCCWAIIDSKISRLVLGCRHAQMGRRDIGSYSVDALVAMTGRPLEIVTGIRAKECEAQRKSWGGWKAFQGEV
ncbi:MAG TPA: nucleoside deaminase [Burkholderiales bacterium]|nr:nucleoside deaminase [Burkholderiales bacterium]